MRLAENTEYFEQNVHVDFKTHVWFTENLFEPANNVLAKVLIPTGVRPPKLLVVVESGILSHHPKLADAIGEYARLHDLDLVAPPLVLEGGEAIKHSLDGVHKVLEAINAGDIDRHSYVVTIGGGAFLDATGFAVATAHRGVRCVRVPTTVLSQDDSGVGVKNAINLFSKKNWWGSFQPPHAVLNDASFLTTLPDREWRGGMAEAVKIALIRDGGFFDELERNAARLAARDMQAMRDLVKRCALGHMAHIREGGDPFEMGAARPLDHGHWSAHKLEAISSWEIRHGEAVAIGLALDAVYARRKGYLSSGECERILRLLTALGFALWAPELESRGANGELQIVLGLEEFRQHLGGELTITLIEGIGDGFEVHEMDGAVIAASVGELKQRFGLREAA